MLTRLYDVFSDAQGQLTPKSAAEFCPNWNSTKLLSFSLLPARMKKIQSNMDKLECLQDFPNHKSMGIFSNAQGQLTPQSLVESCQILNSFQILWLSFIFARLKKI